MTSRKETLPSELRGANKEDATIKSMQVEEKEDHNKNKIRKTISKFEDTGSTHHNNKTNKN